MVSVVDFLGGKYFTSFYILYSIFLIIYVILLLSGVNIKSVGNLTFSVILIILGSILGFFVLNPNNYNKIKNIFGSNISSLMNYILYGLLFVIYSLILLVPQLITIIGEMSNKAKKVMDEKVFNTKIKDKEINNIRLYKLGIYAIPAISFIFITLYEKGLLYKGIGYEKDLMQYFILLGILLLLNSSNVIIALEYIKRLNSYLYINL